MDTSPIKLWLDLVIALVGAGESILKDPKNIESDLAAIIPVVSKIQPAVASLSQIPAAVSALEKESLDELIKYVEGLIPSLVGSPKVVSIIDAALSSLQSVMGLIGALKA